MKQIEVVDAGLTSRREFCGHACHAAAVAALGLILPGCGGSSPSGPSGMGGLPALPVVNATLTNGAFVLTIDAASPLSAVGSAALVNASGFGFLVAHTAQDTFVALTSTCTHQNCTITGYQSGTYECPCHGSRFTTSGAVVSGPAPRALQQFGTSFANGQLTVTTG